MNAQGELFPMDAAAARAAGERGALAAEQAAERRGFSTYAAIAFFWRFLEGAKNATPGEELVRAAKDAGIVPHDDRAFGAAFQVAIRDGVIRPVGFCARTRGHGTAGGRLYVRGAKRPA